MGPRAHRAWAVPLVLPAPALGPNDSPTAGPAGRPPGVPRAVPGGGLPIHPTGAPAGDAGPGTSVRPPGWASGACRGLLIQRTMASMSQSYWFSMRSAHWGRHSPGRGLTSQRFWTHQNTMPSTPLSHRSPRTTLRWARASSWCCWSVPFRVCWTGPPWPAPTPFCVCWAGPPWPTPGRFPMASALATGALRSGLGGTVSRGCCEGRSIPYGCNMQCCAGSGPGGPSQSNPQPLHVSNPGRGPILGALWTHPNHRS